MHEEACEAVEEAVAADSGWVGILGYGYAVTGRREEAVEVTDALTEDIFLPAHTKAMTYAALSEIEQPLDWLEWRIADWKGTTSYIKVEPESDPLHSEPRSQALLKRLGLDQRRCIP